MSENTFCEWSVEEDTNWWQTGCGEDWIIPEGNPVENGMKFCPICGKKFIIKDKANE